jgi:hypothetical protein
VQEIIDALEETDKIAVSLLPFMQDPSYRDAYRATGNEDRLTKRASALARDITEIHARRAKLIELLNPYKGVVGHDAYPAFLELFGATMELTEDVTSIIEPQYKEIMEIVSIAEKYMLNVKEDIEANPDTPPPVGTVEVATDAVATTFPTNGEDNV